jgi:hypothetical protein
VVVNQAALDDPLAMLAQRVNDNLVRRALLLGLSRGRQTDKHQYEDDRLHRKQNQSNAATAVTSAHTDHAM